SFRMLRKLFCHLRHVRQKLAPLKDQTNSRHEAPLDSAARAVRLLLRSGVAGAVLWQGFPTRSGNREIGLKPAANIFRLRWFCLWLVPDVPFATGSKPRPQLHSALSTAGPYSSVLTRRLYRRTTHADTLPLSMRGDSLGAGQASFVQQLRHL